MGKKRPRSQQIRPDAGRLDEPARPGSKPVGEWPLGSAALAAGLALYALWFFWQPLRELSRDPAAPVRRLDFFVLLMTDATSIWTDRWFGGGDWAIRDRLPIAGAAALILALAWGAGRGLLRLAGAQRGCSPLERFVLSLGCGLNILSLATLLLGLAGGTRQRSVVLAGGAAVAGASLWMSWQNRRLPGTPGKSTDPRAADDSRPSWLLLAGVPFVIFTLLGGMLPATDFDVREYHLQAPKEFFLAGRITLLPHNVYANMPLGTEMHSLLGMMILDDWWRGALVGKTVQACFVPLTGLALLAAGRRWVTQRAGAWGAVIFVSTPWIVHVAAAGLVEAAAAFYLCAALFGLLRWRDAIRPLDSLSQRPPTRPNQPRQPGEGGAEVRPVPSDSAIRSPAVPVPRSGSFLLLAGFLAGSAVATKYPAALFVVFPLAMLTCWWGRGMRIRAAALFLLAVTAACGPWLLKNAWLTGNPTYPLLYEVFGGAGWTPEKNARWNAAHRPDHFAVADPDGSIPRDLVESMTDVFVRSPWLNFVTWPFALVALLALRRWRVAGVLWGYVLFVLIAWWLLTHRIDRFWVPMLSIASLLAGVGACLRDQRSWRIVAGVALAIALVYDLTLAVTNTGPGSSNRYFMSLARLRHDPERLRPWQLWLNEHTPPGKRVLAEGDAAVFDLEMPVTYHTAFDDSPLVALLTGKTADQRRAALKEFAFVYVNWAEINRYRSPGNYGYSPQVTPELFDELLRQKVLGAPVALWPDSGVLIYPVQ